jgi:hypothetical protein
MMNRMPIALAAGALVLAGTGAASAQTVVVEPGYAPPAYVVAPAPVYTVPVAPAPVYVAPAPAYVAPARPWRRHVVIEARPAWEAAPGIVYSDW